MRKLMLIFSCCIVFLFNIAEAVPATVEEQRRAVIETARAYNRQGVQIQYDSFRKNYYASPEDATSQHYNYTVCSCFVFQVYYQALGIELPRTTAEMLDYAEVNKTHRENILFYYGTSNEIYNENVLGTDDNPNYLKFSEELLEVVQPGDILVIYRASDSGHAMMVESVDKTKKEVRIIESSGDRYYYETQIEKYDKTGSIRNPKTLNDKLKEFYDNRNKNSKLTRMCIIRIITDGENYIDENNNINTYNGLTESAKARLKYPSIDIEKTIKISNKFEESKSHMLADLGDFLTYTIIVTNNSETDYDEFEIIENVDASLMIEDKGDARKTGNKLTWNIHGLDSKSTIEKNYTVRIPDESNLLGNIIISNGKVAGINNSRVETLIGNKLCIEDKNKLLSAFNNLKDNDMVEREFINQIYINALNLDIKLAGVSNLDIMNFNTQIEWGGEDELAVRHTELNEIELKKYIYNNFYGFRIGSQNKKQNIVRASLQWNHYARKELNDRARTITKNMLDDGDIILLYTEIDEQNKKLEDKSYIYLKDELWRKTAASTFERLSGDDLTAFLRNIIGNNYVILKPSLGIYDIKPTIVLTSDNETIETQSFIKIIAKGDKTLSDVEYRWNNEKKTTEALEGLEKTIFIKAPKKEGEHILYVAVTDVNNNTMEEQYLYTVIDLGKIEITVIPGGRKIEAGNSVEIIVEGKKELNSITYSWDDEEPVTELIADKKVSTKLQVPDILGRHTLYVIAENEDGNKVEDEFNYIVESADKIKPTIEISPSLGTVTPGKKMELILKDNEELKSVTYTWDDEKNILNIISGVEKVVDIKAPTKKGIHTLYVTAIDVAGNKTNEKFEYNVKSSASSSSSSSSSSKKPNTNPTTSSKEQPSRDTEKEIVEVVPEETLINSSLPVKDVKKEDWFYEPIAYVINNGLMTGYVNGDFYPQVTLSRAMVAQILYNAENCPASDMDGTFSDIGDESWYKYSVYWAKNNNIVSGYKDGSFKPDQGVTREQLAVMLWKYSKYKNYKVETDGGAAFKKYNDTKNVSDWAIPALEWACSNKIINGNNNTISPKGYATRAEMAQVLMNFMTKYENTL